MRVKERMTETLVKFDGDIRHHSGGAIKSRARRSRTLMEPNGDIRHHFRGGNQSKQLTPRVEGNEVGNLEEIV
ncbi:hypothetical protein Tco_0177992 [Tanacetum coccineum]